MRIIVIEDNELYKNELLQCLEQEESDIEIVGSASNGAEGLALTETCDGAWCCRFSGQTVESLRSA